MLFKRKRLPVESLYWYEGRERAREKERETETETERERERYV